MPIVAAGLERAIYTHTSMVKRLSLLLIQLRVGNAIRMCIYYPYLYNLHYCYFGEKTAWSKLFLFFWSDGGLIKFISIYIYYVYLYPSHSVTCRHHFNWRLYLPFVSGFIFVHLYYIYSYIHDKNKLWTAILRRYLHYLLVNKNTFAKKIYTKGTKCMRL